MAKVVQAASSNTAGGAAANRVATKEPEKNVAPLAPSAVSANLTQMLGDYKGPIGDETIENEDISIPRLKIGQSMSEEVKSSKVKEGALFINVSGQTVWNPDDATPLLGLIVARNKEFILWRPVEDGGGILARAQRVQDPNTGVVRYKWDQPNKSFEVKVGGKIKQVWTTKEYCGFGKGKSVDDLAKDEDNLGLWGSELANDPESSPAATAHHNYLLMLPSQGNLIAAVSMSRSQTKVAMNLNAAIKMGDKRYPLPLRKFFFSTVTETNDDFKYKNWAFSGGNEYLLEMDSTGHKLISCPPENEATVIAAMNYFGSFQQGGYKVDQSDAATADGGRAATGVNADGEM